MKNFKMYDDELLSVGDTIRFYDLWQSKDGNINDILESGCVWINDDKDDIPVIAAFEIVESNQDDPVESIVKILDIF